MLSQSYPIPSGDLSLCIAKVATKTKLNGVNKISKYHRINAKTGYCFALCPGKYSLSALLTKNRNPIDFWHQFLKIHIKIGVTEIRYKKNCKTHATCAKIKSLFSSPK